MMNYEQTIFCDKNTEILHSFPITPVDVLTPNIFVKQDLTIEYAITRYTDKFVFYKNDTIIGNSLRHYGEYTELEIELLKNFLNKNSIVYDVGANIGYHTLAFSKLAKHVYAFEPNKKNYKLLKKNTEYLDNVSLYDIACSDSNTELHVEDFDTNVPGNYGEMHTQDVGQSCNAIRIDDLDDVYGPDLIKIDVEGHELPVLKGCYLTITEFNPIIFYEAHGSDLAEIYDYLTNLDYTLYWYPCMNFNVNNYRKNPNNVFGHGSVVNILAMPKTHKKISNLIQVLDRDDTIQLAFKRAQELNK